MDFRKKLQDKIKKQMEKIDKIESELREAQVYLSALQDTLKLAPRSNGSTNNIAKLRSGSLVALARDCLRKAGKPMHVKNILVSIGKEVNRSNRVSLSSSIRGYIRKDQIFTSDVDSPNTFGLKEFEENNKDDDISVNEEEIPF